MYENLIDGILDVKEYAELKQWYKIKIDDYKQRATALQQMLNDEKVAKASADGSLCRC